MDARRKPRLHFFRRSNLPCYDPLNAWYGRRPDGTLGIVFKGEYAIPADQEVMRLPCGQCAGCRLDRAKAWAARCIQEASLHRDNVFITCTYDEENLPEKASLQPSDFVKFLKRLRKKMGQFRYFQCGEYGEKFSRPHHHAILFGLDFYDKQLYYTKNNFPYYISQILNDTWTHGICIISDVTFDSAMYVARYITKKITGPLAKEYYDGRVPEYITMSRRPGIAYDWYKKYKDDLYNYDRFVVRDGFIIKPPRFFDSKFKQEEMEAFEEIKSKRIEKAKEVFDNTEQGYYRRCTKEKHMILKNRNKVRSYEGN